MKPTPATAIVSSTDLIAKLDDYGVPRHYGCTHRLRRVREPQQLNSIGMDIHDREQFLARPAARAWHRMQHAAATDKVTLEVVSAYRSIAYQCGIIERKLARGQCINGILAVSAAPGYSEHHSGRALDLTCLGYRALEEEFEDSPAFAWLSSNADRFRFSLSYPRGNRHGIAYEPWHWCWHKAGK